MWPVVYVVQFKQTNISKYQNKKTSLSQNKNELTKIHIFFYSSLSCESVGKPSPQISWYKDRELFRFVNSNLRINWKILVFLFYYKMFIFFLSKFYCANALKIIIFIFALLIFFYFSLSFSFLTISLQNGVFIFLSLIFFQQCDFIPIVFHFFSYLYYFYPCSSFYCLFW